jgi:hypothetical protein
MRIKSVSRSRLILHQLLIGRVAMPPVHRGHSQLICQKTLAADLPYILSANTRLARALCQIPNNFHHAKLSATHDMNILLLFLFENKSFHPMRITNCMLSKYLNFT